MPVPDTLIALIVFPASRIDAERWLRARHTREGRV